MDKQQLREAAAEVIRDISGVFVDALKAASEQTRIEMAQVRQEMRSDALAEALDRLAGRREALTGRLQSARSAALKAALRHELATVEAEEQKLLSAMGLASPAEAVKVEQQAPQLLYVRDGRKFAPLANGNGHAG